MTDELDDILDKLFPKKTSLQRDEMTKNLTDAERIQILNILVEDLLKVVSEQGAHLERLQEEVRNAREDNRDRKLR